MKAVIESIGTTASATLMAVLGLILLAVPVYAWLDRRAWTRAEARVIDIPQRRSLASSTWAVLMEYEAGGTTRRTTLGVNIQKRPLARGDRIEILHHPKNPDRTALGYGDGWSTWVMAAGLMFLFAFVTLQQQ